MGHSFTSFNEKHIRSKDYKVETWLLLIVIEAQNLSHKPEWLCEACEYWQNQGLHGVNGCIDPDLDKYLTGSDRVTLFLEICSSVYSKLNGFGDYVSKELLNSLHNLESPNDIREDNESELYLLYGRKLMDLLRGDQKEECVSV
jgi:hypothetical protein